MSMLGVGASIWMPAVTGSAAGPGAIAGATLDMNFADGAYVGATPAQLTVTRATPAIAYAETLGGQLVGFAPNVARITNKGLLTEEARTNFCIRSQEFDNASWTKNNTTVTADSAAAPDGTTTADTFTESATSSTHTAFSTTIAFTTATAYVLSVYAKASTGSLLQLTTTLPAFSTGPFANYDLSAGTVTNSGGGGTGSIQALGNGWYRCILAATADASTNSQFVITRINTSGASRSPSYLGTLTDVFLWGAQVEAGAFVTSYIPTTTVAVTRAVDSVRLTGAPLTAVVTQGIGTFYAQGFIPHATFNSNYFLYDLTDGGVVGANEIAIYCNPSTNPLSWNTVMLLASAQQTNFFGTTPGAVNGRHKFAQTYMDNSFQAAVDGTLTAVDLAGTVPTALDRLQIGGRANTTFMYNGYVERLVYLPQKLSSSDLAALPASPQTINFNFAAGSYNPSLLTVTRATPPLAYSDDSDGNWIGFAPNTLRVTDKGARIEEARTNSIRNNSMQGAAVGTPGTNPTNWSIDPRGATKGILAIESYQGVDTIVIALSDTVVNNTPYINFEPISTSAPAASPGQTWTGSFFFQRLSGTAAYSIAVVIIPLDAAGSPIGGSVTTSIPGANTGTWQRVAVTLSSAPASTAFVTMRITWAIPDATTLSEPLVTRVGWPQLELGAFATSPIRTTTAAVTRAIDGIVMLPAVNPFNGSHMTIYAEGIPIADFSATQRRLVEIDDNTVNDRIVLGVVTGPAGSYVINDGGVTQASITAGVVVPGAVVKMAAAYAPNSFNQATNGTLGTLDSSGTQPTIDRMHFGVNAGLTPTAMLNGYLRQVIVRPERIADASLPALTT